MANYQYVVGARNMALKDFLKLNKPELREKFAAKPYDAERARGPIIKALDKASDQYASATPVKGRKMWKSNNGVIELTLPFEIEGETVATFEPDEFFDALKHLKEAVAGGELDDAIKAANEADPATAATSTTTRKARAPRPTSTGGGNGWPEERRAKFNATIAARKAAEGK
jgi:hypothetical protein